MNIEDKRVRQLIFWNRLWFVLLLFVALFEGCNYLGNYLISNAMRLQLTWNGKGKDSSLTFSSAAGGPFVVTQLVTQSGAREMDTAIAAIAQLPHPLFVRGPKAITYISSQELAKLIWLDAGGKKVATPKPGDPVQALYFTTQKVTTSE